MSRKLSGLILVLALLSPVIAGCGPAESPVEIISVSDVWPPAPGGPTIEIVLKNISEEPVIQLTAVLKVDDNLEYDFGVSTVAPLLPGESSTDKRSITGPGQGIEDNRSYSLKISGTFQSGEEFSFTQKVRIGSRFPL